MVEDPVTTNQHEIIISNRNAIEITGVIRLESFDREEFLLYTEFGYLGIQGQNLQIKSLDLELGRISIEGQMGDIRYLEEADSTAEKNESLLGRLFR